MPWRRDLIWLVTALAAVLLVTQVLALGTQHFQAQVNSDDLYPFVFSQDVLHGIWPVSGWTLSSAPYVFPDFAFYTLLIGLTGLQGASIPSYAVLSAVAFALTAGWLLTELEPARGSGWLRGFLVADTIVALGFLPGLDRWIWWQFAPGFHGGAVLVTIAIAALAASDLTRGPSRVRAGALVVLLWLGVWSDSFVIVEGVLPITFALIYATWERADFVGPVRRFLGAGVAAFALLVLTKLWLAWREIFFAGRVFRYTPTPARFATTALAWWHDLWGERTLMTAWIGLSLALLLFIWWRSLRATSVTVSEREDRERMRFLVTWAWLGAGSVVGALWFMGYWHDVSNARYLVALQSIPIIGLAACVRWPARWSSRRLAGTATGALAVGLFATAIYTGAKVRPSRLTFPYPDEIAQLDGFCRDRHFSRGLGDYWTLHYFNVLTQSSARLSPLRGTANSTYAAGTPSFWNNNVYGFLDRDRLSGKWLCPAYQFIVVNRLDESSLRARYGEPREVVQVGPWKIWIPGDPNRLSASVLQDVEVRLKGRRWDAVKKDLAEGDGVN